jgi:hypothetical protein
VNILTASSRWFSQWLRWTFDVEHFRLRVALPISCATLVVAPLVDAPTIEQTSTAWRIFVFATGLVGLILLGAFANRSR